METGALGQTDLSLFEQEYHRLRLVLEEEHHATTLPEAPSSAAALHDLLIRLRLNGVSPG